MASLFTVQTPSGTDNSDGAPGIGTATTLRFTEDGDVTGIRFFATVTVSGTYTVALYQVTDAAAGGAGTLLESKVAGVAPTGGAWNTVVFDDAVPVTTGILYRAVLHSDAGRYVNTAAFFVEALTNGSIVADSNGDASAGFGVLAQGTFEINAALTFPNDTFNASCYFVDVEFTAAGDVTVIPDSLAVPVALGAPTVPPVAVSPDSVSIPVSLGAPFLHVAPDSISLPVALGAPTVVGPAAPTVRTGWSSYGDALRFNFDQAALERDRAPLDCPNDGEALVFLGDGTRRCPADGWQWPARRIIERG